MASLTRWFDRLVVLFFIAHIPTTLFFDAQAGRACKVPVPHVRSWCNDMQYD